MVAGYRAPYEPPRDPLPEPHIDTNRPGELVGIDCYFVGRLHGANGPVWQITAIDDRGVPTDRGDDETRALLQLAHAVRSRRGIAGLSQEALADRSGLHRTYVGGIERGERNVSLINLLRLAGALDVSVAELVEGIELGIHHG